MAGSPAVDFFVGAERNWSNISGTAYTQWRIAWSSRRMALLDNGVVIAES
jgi:hypothetical protein